MGQATDSGFPDVMRDRGDGGSINGKNIIVFSDTSTSDGTGGLKGFTSDPTVYV